MKLLKNINSHTESRKNAIIQAGLELFTEKGFSETGMADICKAAQASTGSVYHHFKSKEQLAAAVYLEGITEYQQGLIEALSLKKEARSGIKAIITYHLTWVAENPRWAQYLFQQRHAHFMSNSDNKINTLNKTFAEGIAAWFKEQIQHGKIRPMPWDLIIAVLLGPCQEYSRLYLSGKAASSIKEAIKVLSNSAWKALSLEKDKS